MTATLYLTRNGLLEPLGQSQVMSYLRGLAAEHAITLVTFEKPEDMADSAAMARARADCAAHGIDWRPRRFRRRPRLLASAWSLVAMGTTALRLARSGQLGLIHARSYLPAGVAWAVWRLTGTAFIFDMRALWPEELITAGRLKRGSPLHRLLERLERLCLRDATAIVSLTEAAVDHLERRYPEELAGKRIRVIPTCADLDRFTPPPEPPTERVYGCVGTVLSGWFKTDWLAAFFRAVARREPDARFEVVTRDDPETVRARLDPDAALNLSIFAAPPERVHLDVRRQTASAMFYAGGEISELGRSPTRMAEILGCGIPVIANDGVGDVARIIRRYRVGVIARDGSDAAMDAAAAELEQLRKEPDLARRCRQAAEEVFSLDRGTEAYRQLYAEILGGQAPRGATAPESAEQPRAHG
ncbi:glycosyltransferase [Rhodosalinus halophilus]|uniref:Glycosyltransferase n=1 Tax=Rhodosalinus halophilus TaxID=2259333 RepID=A0A365U5A4_9RHOB|nr:glycosyltransferase [Rhodosalinus halophilus]RBI83313.1 glycosyltransferase [Rhodosalinus halophilus]